MQFTTEFIKQQLKENGFDLITETYRNAHQHLVIKDSDGYLYYMTWDNISHGRKSYMVSPKNPFSTRNVMHYIKVNKLNFELISPRVVSTKSKIILRCKCGKLFQTTWDKIKSKTKTTCNKCSLKARGVKHRVSKEKILFEFSKNGLTPLNLDNVASTNKLTCKDVDGYFGLISYHQLMSGMLFDRFSLKNPFLKNNVENFIAIKGFTCKLITKDFSKINSFTNAPIEFECECGNKFATTWRSFSYQNVYRCPSCSGKQSQYEHLTEQRLKHHKLDYEKEFTFNECKDQMPLRFDFKVNFAEGDFALIEVDGQFHFKDYFGDYEKQQKRDEIKNAFCISNNISLIRIPYWCFKDDSYLKIIDMEVSKHQSYKTA